MNSILDRVDKTIFEHVYETKEGHSCCFVNSNSTDIKYRPNLTYIYTSYAYPDRAQMYLSELRRMGLSRDSSFELMF